MTRPVALPRLSYSAAASAPPLGGLTDRLSTLPGVGTAGSGDHADCGLGCKAPTGLTKPPADPPCDTTKMTNECESTGT